MKLLELKSIRTGIVKNITRPTTPEMANWYNKQLELINKKINEQLQLTLQFPQEEWKENESQN